MIEKSKYFESLYPGPNDVVIERDNDFIWIDENEIIYSVPKENQIALTREETIKQINEWEAQYGSRKWKILLVVNPHVKSSKEDRDFAAAIFQRYISAMAVINESALGRMAINLFLGLKPPKYPFRVFKNQEDAKSWLINLEVTENGN